MRFAGVADVVIALRTVAALSRALRIDHHDSLTMRAGERRRLLLTLPGPTPIAGLDHNLVRHSGRSTVIDRHHALMAAFALAHVWHCPISTPPLTAAAGIRMCTAT